MVLALSRAALFEGWPAGHLDGPLDPALEAASLHRPQRIRLATSREVSYRVEETTVQFHALWVNERPTSLLESAVGN